MQEWLWLQTQKRLRRGPVRSVLRAPVRYRRPRGARTAPDRHYARAVVGARDVGSEALETLLRAPMQMPLLHRMAQRTHPTLARPIDGPVSHTI